MTNLIFEMSNSCGNKQIHNMPDIYYDYILVQELSSNVFIIINDLYYTRIYFIISEIPYTRHRKRDRERKERILY